MQDKVVNVQLHSSNFKVQVSTYLGTHIIQRELDRKDCCHDFKPPKIRQVTDAPREGAAAAADKGNLFEDISFLSTVRRRPFDKNVVPALIVV